MTKKHKVIQMFSGGLDSIISSAIMKNEGFEVIGVHFHNGFNDMLSRDIENGPNWDWTPKQSVLDAAEKLDMKLIPMNCSEEFHDVEVNPRFGYGCSVNPCIDCRIFFLNKARVIMEEEGAICVCTGEVMGQRPMSQHKSALRQVEKHSAITGRLLRPLCAKLLPPTIPETEGIINRDHMFEISGRSRKPQMELAKKFGIDWYPSSGGGCILTDISYGKKFNLLKARKNGKYLSPFELNALKTGRHIILESGVWIIVGRIEQENDYLDRLFGPNRWRFESKDYPGAAVYAFDEPGEDDFATIAAITARYGKGVHEDSVTIIASKQGETRELNVKPLDHKDIEPFMIT